MTNKPWDLYTLKNWLKPFENFTISQTQGILTAILCVFILTLGCVVIVSTWKRSEKKPVLVVSGAMTIICLFLAIIPYAKTVQLYKIALSHGFDKDDKNVTTLTDLYGKIEKSPKEDMLPTDVDSLKNVLIIYYKLGCADCEGINKELMATIEGQDDIYVIYTRSDTGKKLRETYPVKNVPSGMYIKSDKTPVMLPLHDVDKDGNTCLNQKNLDTLLTLLHAKS